MPRDPRLSKVELIESDVEPVDDDASSVPDAAFEPNRRRRWLPSRRTWGVLAVAAALVLGLVVAQVVVDLRARAVDARIAGLPGATRDIGESLDVLWQPGRELWWPSAVVDGVVAAAERRDDSTALVARDLDTGTERWTVPLSPASAEDTEPPNVTCDPPPSGRTEPGFTPDVAVCFASDGSRPGMVSSGKPWSATWSRLVVVDLRTGTAVAEHDLARPALAAAVLDDVTALLRVDGATIEISGVDPVTGKELWQYRDPEPLSERAGDQWVFVSQSGGLVVVQTSAGAYALTPDGERRDDLDDGRSIGPFYEVTGDPEDRTEVHRPGLAPMDVLGLLLPRTLDDGSVPGLEVSFSGQWAYGWDAATGDKRWESKIGTVDGDEVLVAEGRVHLMTRTGPVALDGRTGAELWRHELPARQVDIDALMCDGAHILVQQSDLGAEGPSVLVVLDRRTGAHVRDVPVPESVMATWSLGHRVVGFGQNVVVLG